MTPVYEVIIGIACARQAMRDIQHQAELDRNAQAYGTYEVRS